MQIVIGVFETAKAVAEKLIEIIRTSECAGSLHLQRIEFHRAEDFRRRLSSLDLQPTLILLVINRDAEREIPSLLPCQPNLNGMVTPVILVSDACEPQLMLQWLETGAADYIVAPFTRDGVLPRILRVVAAFDREQAFVQELKAKVGLKQILGESPEFRAEINKIPLAAKCDASVLITGETGTGKELYARAIHYLSARRAHPFVPVNCGAIPAELFENELFGHERGAYTGAVTAQPGLIQQAEHGTLLLDEVDCLPLWTQTKLLRFLQDKIYQPLGAGKAKQADVRILAASNADLEASVNAGKLRQDLYYRLNVVPVKLPPLRQRRTDVALLTEHFLQKYAQLLRQPKKTLSTNAMNKLERYDWPGNVRELEHLIERTMILVAAPCIRSGDLDLPDGLPAASETETFQSAKSRCVAAFEREYLKKILHAHQGNISRAASAASKDRRTFWELLRKHHIDPAVFKAEATANSSRR